MLVKLATKHQELNDTFHLQDHDHDGRLSFADFEKSVKEENLFLEAFGTCLPDDVVNPNLKMLEIHLCKLNINVLTFGFCFLPAN